MIPQKPHEQWHIKREVQIGGAGNPANSTGGAAGGKAVALNGNSVIWTGGAASSSRAYGAVA